MKSKIILVLFTLLLSASCGSNPPANNAPAVKPSPSRSAAAAVTPVPSASVPKNGDYNGKGVVTKINLEQGSVEMDHEEIKDLMPRMIMEFFVSDKKLLDGLKVGDKVDFIVRYKDHTETVVGIKKAQ